MKISNPAAYSGYVSRYRTSAKEGKGTFAPICVSTRKLVWPAIKLRFAPASSSQGALRAGRLMMTPATMALTPLRPIRAHVSDRTPGSP